MIARRLPVPFDAIPLAVGVIIVLARAAQGMLVDHGDASMPLVLAAWGAVAAAALVLAVTVLRRGRIDGPPLAAFLALAAIAVATDIAATRLLIDEPGTRTASTAVAGLVLALMPSARTGVVLVAATVYSGAILVSAALAPAILLEPLSIVSTALAVVPCVVAAAVVASYRRLDDAATARLSLAEAEAPPDDGLHDTTLRALDVEIEALLAGVGDGTLPLPLDAEATRRARELAAALRSRLLRDARSSWIVDAVARMPVLDAIVEVDDGDGRARRLDPEQRSELLTVLLLAATTGARRPERIHVLVTGGPGRVDAHIDIVGSGRRGGGALLRRCMARLGEVETRHGPDGFGVVLRIPVVTEETGANTVLI